MKKIARLWRWVSGVSEWHQFLQVVLSPTISTTHTGAAKAAASSLESSPSKKLAPDSSDKADGSSS
ncbi:hypothetical protein F2Q69_00009266 [Brassica cretica]|uniref:Uncharacterized protein n=1 Tax=Brassica cretica TaxID=69181 RepID=A0A8S9P5N7_BRACR|nr:hypothetical protein F2Q69_00009266 [Brassica cretica]